MKTISRAEQGQKKVKGPQRNLKISSDLQNTQRKNDLIHDLLIKFQQQAEKVPQVPGSSLKVKNSHRTIQDNMPHRYGEALQEKLSDQLKCSDCRIKNQAVRGFLKSKYQARSLNKLGLKLGNQEKKVARKIKHGLFSKNRNPKTSSSNSKKSTNSSEKASQILALKEINEKMKDLCEQELEKLARLELEIQNELKINKLRNQLYQQSIQKLERIADSNVFDMVQTSKELEDHQDDDFCEFDKEIDCLSLESHQ